MTIGRGRSTGEPTAAQRARWDRIKDPDFGPGCLVAHILGIGWLPAEIHHFTVGGRHGQKRRGHDYTIGLNQWSHRGIPLPGWTAEECAARLGPSYAQEPAAFRERFGSDDDLLALQNAILGD
jgi:hypothetical protein